MKQCHGHDVKGNTTLCSI